MTNDDLSARTRGRWILPGNEAKTTTVCRQRRSSFLFQHHCRIFTSTTDWSCCARKDS